MYEAADAEPAAAAPAASPADASGAPAAAAGAGLPVDAAGSMAFFMIDAYENPDQPGAPQMRPRSCSERRSSLNAAAAPLPSPPPVGSCRPAPPASS
jgi:hypothetical protein